MIVPSFSRPSSELLYNLPKTAPCTGILTELKNDVMLVEEYTHSAGETHNSVETSDSSADAAHKSSLKLHRCSSKEVCLRQRSGEVCTATQCCHMCTGQFDLRTSPNLLHKSSDSTACENATIYHPLRTYEQHQFVAFGSDTNSDPDDDDELLSGWHSMDHSSGHLFALLQHRYSQEQPEVDHAGSRQGACCDQRPEDQVQEEETFQCSVQETNPHLPKHEEELVLSEPLVFSWFPVHREERHDMKHDIVHVYTRPFVCNMPALQPTFVGEQ